MFDAMRRDELMLHLSLKTAALKLDVLPAAISQLVDPDVAVIIGAPRPRILAGQLAMIGNVDHAPIRLLVIDPEIVTLGIARKQREEVWHFTKPADVDTLFDRKLEDGPERVRVRFAHRIVETQIRRSGSAGRGPVPVASRHRATIIQRDFRFEHARSRS